MTEPRRPSELFEPPSLLDEEKRSAVADLIDIGLTLAETLDARPCQLHSLRILYEPTTAAKLSAAVLHMAYSAAQRRAYRSAPEASAPTALWEPVTESIGERPPGVEAQTEASEPPSKESLSQYTSDASRMLAYYTERIGSVKPNCPEGDGAEKHHGVLLIGHDPRMTWLLGRMLRPRRFLRNWLAAPVPALAHTELVACEPVGRKRYAARWTLAPSDDKTENDLLLKIKSKMDTAKVFAGVLTAITIYAAGNLPAANDDRVTALVGLTLLGISIALYLVTMFWYDGLMMPKRFWSSTAPRPGWVRPAPLKLRWNRLARPPTSSTWLLFQNMRLVWSRVFVPSTVMAGAGLTCYVFGAAGVRSEADRIWVIAGLGAIVVIAGGLGIFGRPRLGAQD